MTDRIWVTWEKQRRNQTLSATLHSKLHQLNCGGHRLLRYLVLIWKTLYIYWKEKPKVIIFQNPSIVLALITVLYRKLTGIFIITDAHNAGVFPFEGKKRWANYLSIYIMKNSNIYIVTNEGLASHVRECGGNPYILPDPIPDFRECNITIKELRGRWNVFFICTFAGDEPYLEVIKSARYLPDGICIYISGDLKKMNIALDSVLPKNVFLTGYLPEDEYLGMLKHSEIVMDLTTRENCLVCGAYESIAMGTPLILSNTQANKNYFYKGVVYTDSTYIDISEKIKYAIKNKEKLTEEIKDLKKVIQPRWEESKWALNSIIQDHIDNI